MHNNQTSATVISTTTHEKNSSEDRLHLKDVTHESQTTNGHVNHQFRTNPSYSKMIGSTFPKPIPIKIPCQIHQNQFKTKENAKPSCITSHVPKSRRKCRSIITNNRSTIQASEIDRSSPPTFKSELRKNSKS